MILCILSVGDDLGSEEKVRSVQDAVGQLVASAQGVPSGGQVLQKGPPILQRHTNQPGVLVPRGVQGAFAADGRKTKGHETSGQHLQENS